MKEELRRRIGQQVALRLVDSTIVRGTVSNVTNDCVVLSGMREVTSYTVSGVTDGLNWTGVPQLVQLKNITRAWQPTWA